MTFQVEKIRQDFPILSQKVYDRPIVYFDNGATTQKPSVVIDTVRRYYEEQNASIHRGVHFLSDRSTETYENARERVRQFMLHPPTKSFLPAGPLLPSMPWHFHSARGMFPKETRY